MKVENFLKQISINPFLCKRLLKSSQEKLEDGFNYEFEFEMEDNSKVIINATDDLELYKCTFTKMDNTPIYECYTYNPIETMLEHIKLDLII